MPGATIREIRAHLLPKPCIHGGARYARSRLCGGLREASLWHPLSGLLPRSSETAAAASFFSKKAQKCGAAARDEGAPSVMAKLPPE